MSRIIISAICALLAGATSVGQDTAAPKPPFEWKLTGDTSETLKVELTVNQKVDQSTARGVVEVFLAFTDERDAAAKSEESVTDRITALVKTSLAPREEKLLTKEALQALAKAREQKPVREAVGCVSAAEVKKEDKRDDGSVVMEVTQKRVSIEPGADGKKLERASETTTRFTCAKGEGEKWRITAIEKQKPGPAGEPDGKWIEDFGHLGFMYLASHLKFGIKPVEPQQDTPANAAQSIYSSLIARQESLGIDLFTGKVLPP